MSTIFFDGRVSRAHPARYVRTPYTIRITYTDAEENEHTVEWLLSKTKLATWSPSGKTRLQFGPFPHQYLDIDTDDYRTQFSTGGSLPKPVSHEFFRFLLNRGLQALMLFGVAVLTIVWLLYTYGIPALSERVARQLPVEQEIKLGDLLYSQLEKTGQVKASNPQTTRVNQFWQATGIKTRIPVKIVVVPSKEINAFAVPGGHVVVFTGILEKFTRPEQLAALLAHEAAHVEYRHSLQQLIRSVTVYGLIAFVFGDVSGIMALLLDNADNLVSLSYSREHEADADAFAVTQLARHGINPMGAVWLTQALPTEGDEVPTLLRSHPHNAQRVAATSELAKKTQIQGVASPKLIELWQSINAASAN